MSQTKAQLVDNTKVTYTASGTGAAARTVDSKLGDFVSVKDFGAVGDGAANDQAAIQTALNTGKSVFFPAGTYIFNSSIVFGGDNQHFYGEGNNSILRSGSGSAYINSGGRNHCAIRNLQINGDGTNGGIRITDSSKDFVVNNVYFYRGGQRVWLYACEFVTVSNCTFEECGYQIIQQLGYASSNSKVVNCVSTNCENDFVELNCEFSNPSKNWLVANNVVKNVGMVGATSAKTESRFVGATMVDGIVISGNIVDGVAGDSAVHLERPGRTIITGNTFRNVQGSAYIYLIPGVSSGWSTSQDVIISSNTFLQDAATLSGTSKVFIRSLDNIYYNNLNITNNQFYYYGTSYPTDPATKDWVGVEVAFNLNYTRINGNYFKNLVNGVWFGNNSGGSPVISYLPEIDNNHFHLCTTAINFTSTAAYAKSITRNTFQGCTSPWSSLPSNDFLSIANVGANDFISTNVSGFASSFVTLPTWLPDTYQQSTTDDARTGITMAQSVATQLVKIPFGYVGFITIYAESTISANNNTRQVFFVSNRAATSFTSIAAHTAGTAPTISLSASGTYQQIVSATLTGGPAGHPFFVRISFN
jgi:hypothetical protein